MDGARRSIPIRPIDRALCNAAPCILHGAVAFDALPLLQFLDPCWGAVEPNSERELTVRVVSDQEDLRFAV